MGNIVTHNISVETWPLGTPAEMLSCLTDLQELGYRGQVRVWHVDNEPVWDLELNSDNRPSVPAKIGQVVVLFGESLESMTAEKYAETYGDG